MFPRIFHKLPTRVRVVLGLTTFIVVFPILFVWSFWWSTRKAAWAFARSFYTYWYGEIESVGRMFRTAGEAWRGQRE